MESTIAKISKTKITLSDGSKYEVSTGDSTVLMCWYATQRVQVTHSGSSDYPYLLQNLDSSAPAVPCRKL